MFDQNVNVSEHHTSLTHPVAI